MLNAIKIYHIALAMVASAVILPIGLAVTSKPASASGYIVAGGSEGFPTCIPADGDDCDPSGS